MLRGLVPMLGALWGGLIAVPIVRRARRVGVRERLRAHRRSRGRELPGLVVQARLRSAFGRVSAPATALVARWTERRGAKATTATIARELPVTIDLLGVAVRAGATPYLAIETAARWSPPIVGERLSAVVVSCRLGAGLGDALDAVVAATPALRP
ncbi:MAG: hypothetical protein L3K06_02305, partial [Thermoplasmata archaeon]|nr:hypothetical protein [Thermoplasmata archaeon]